jgi:uncharacterized protein
MSNEWLGTGMPWTPNVSSVIEAKSDLDILKSSVLFILMTRKGERVMLPEFGCGLSDALFEPNNEGVISEMQEEIRASLRKWDDRIELVNVLTTSEDNTLNVKIIYRDAKDPLKDGLETLETNLPTASTQLF